MKFSYSLSTYQLMVWLQVDPYTRETRFGTRNQHQLLTRYIRLIPRGNKNETASATRNQIPIWYEVSPTKIEQYGLVFILARVFNKDANIEKYGRTTVNTNKMKKDDSNPSTIISRELS